MSVYKTKGLDELLEGLDDKTADLVRKAWYAGARENSLNLVPTVEDLELYLYTDLQLFDEDNTDPHRNRLKELFEQCSNADPNQTLAEFAAEFAPHDKAKPLPLSVIMDDPEWSIIRDYTNSIITAYIERLTGVKL